MMTLNLRRALIAVPAFLLSLHVAAALGQELQKGEAAPAGFSGPGLTAANSVTSIGMSILSPNVVKFGQNITFTFNYDTNQAAGVRIFVRPISIDASGNDILTPNYGACGSPLYPVGSGSGSNCFTILDGNATVEKIRIQMWDANQTTLLFNAKLPVHYKFR
jgi:hypothetical protein